MVCQCGEKAAFKMTLFEEEKTICYDCKNYWESFANNKEPQPVFERLKT